MKSMKALLALADGTVFTGTSFGAEGEATGEVVFNTSLTGYQEILTDPSYKGQIVTMTYPEIGNVGVNPEDVESRRPFLEGFIVKEYWERQSNWRAQQSLGSYLKTHGVVGIQGLDTRALVRHLRDYGEQVGAPDIRSAVSVSAGWSVFAMRDGAAYNTYRVYPHSRLVTPLFSVLLGLLPTE